MYVWPKQKQNKIMFYNIFLNETILLKKYIIFYFFFYNGRFVCNQNSPFYFRGTHGYMAPEVLQKGTAYDSSADWFSLGCMLFKLLRG